MNKIKSVLLDNSFVTRLFKTDDEYRENVVDYFEYFFNNNIDMYLSTIVISEYAVISNPDKLKALNTFQIIDFDYLDAKKSGVFRAFLKGGNETGERNIVINDIKLLAQADNRKIDAFITKDRRMFTKMIEPLKENQYLTLKYLDLTIALNQNKTIF